MRQKDCFVVGIDQSAEMLDGGPARVALAAATRKVRLQEGDARDLPFEDGQFDALTFTYLLRYVEDPPATLRELARVVKPGGTIAGLEFGVPRGDLAPALGALGARRPAGAGRVIGDGWHEVGDVPRPVDPRPLRGVAAAAAARRRGATRGSRTCRRSGSASAAGS